MKEKEEKDAALFKVRSYTSCIAEGFALPLKNFLLLLKYLWPSLVIAIVFIVWTISEAHRLASVFLHHTNYLQVVVQHKSILALLVVLLFFVIVAMSIYIGQIVALIKEYGVVGNLTSVTFKSLNASIWKCSVRSFIFILSFVLFSLACGAISWLLLDSFVWSALAAFVLFLVLLIPFFMVGLQYCLGGFSVLDSLLAWKTGFRYWGALFSILLIGGIVSFVFWFFGSLPALVLSSVWAMANLSEIEGDVAQLPAYFAWAKVLFYAVSAFISLIGVYFFIFPLSFLYGAIEKRMQEKKVYDAEHEVFLKHNTK